MGVSLRIIIETIHQEDQRYPTVGDWLFTGDVLQITVSDMQNDKYAFLVGIHEAVEAFLCRDRGIKEEDVSAFDTWFESRRPEGNTDEPGDDINAPYRKEHFTATNIERLIASELGVDWSKYDHVVSSL